MIEPTRTSRRNKLYNYIVNTFNISKESIDATIEKRVDDVLSRHLKSKLESDYLNRQYCRS